MSWKDITLLYGDEPISQFIPADLNVHVLEPPGLPEPGRTFTDLETRFEDIIANPVDSKALEELVKTRERSRVMILVDDATRPNKHTKILLPLLFKKLMEDYKVKKDDIRLLIASGSHSPPADDLLENKILGPTIYAAWKDHVMIHKQAENCRNLGISTLGTPIWVNIDVLESGLIIAVTDSEYHYFAGVAGTVKQFFPGCAGKETIARNHPQMFDKVQGFKPECRLGNTAGNPVIQDMIQMAQLTKKMVPVFCIDAVMSGEEIVMLDAGDINSLHELRREALKPLRVVEVDRPADLVIVSTGPLSINLYQGGKGFHAGWNAVKEGGDILLLARCDLGHGSQNFYDTMREINGMGLDAALSKVIETKCSIETFKIGNQKVVDLIRILKRATCHMITEMDKEQVEDVFRIKYVPRSGDVQTSLRAWIENFREQKNRDPLVYVLPDAGNYIDVKSR
ncbi:MAG: lactate racemase domain-containing protein [Candidatus Thorarchaeota archaeon]